MPALTSGKVLVTGANGYIATWIVNFLLEAGFAVRGTVRSDDKAAPLHKLFASFGDKFETVVVPDMTKEDAFALHVQDVDAIVHAASPVHMRAIEPEEIIGPAVGGTLAVLNAAANHGPDIKRIIVLSSTATLLHTVSVPTVLDERDWNEVSIAEVKSRGRDASGFHKYRASKILAERAAWKWWEERKDVLGWDLVTLVPPYVFGPVLGEVPSPEELRESMKQWYDHVIVGELDNNALANDGDIMYVDVRDIAFAHILALQKPAASANRFIIAGDLFAWQDFVSEAHRDIAKKVPASNTLYSPSKAEQLLRYDNKKSIEVLGMKYRGIDQLTKDIVDDFKFRGWL